MFVPAIRMASIEVVEKRSDMALLIELGTTGDRLQEIFEKLLEAGGDHTVR